MSSHACMSDSGKLISFKTQGLESSRCVVSTTHAFSNIFTLLITSTLFLQAECGLENRGGVQQHHVLQAEGASEESQKSLGMRQDGWTIDGCAVSLLPLLDLVPQLLQNVNPNRARNFVIDCSKNVQTIDSGLRLQVNDTHA